jgi:hypothetical protein
MSRISSVEASVRSCPVAWRSAVMYVIAAYIRIF